MNSAQWSHCGFRSARADSQGGTPESCLALYFASTPSVNERSTLASPFRFWSGYAGTRGSGTPLWNLASRIRRALLDNSTRDRIDRPLSLLACYIWGSGTSLRDLASRICRALLDNSIRDRTDRPLSLLAFYTLSRRNARTLWIRLIDRLDLAV